MKSFKPESFKPEVLINGTWSTNGLRFATIEEAEASANELMSRWFVPEAGRVTVSNDPVQHRFNFTLNKNEAIV